MAHLFFCCLCTTISHCTKQYMLARELDRAQKTNCDDDGASSNANSNPLSCPLCKRVYAIPKRDPRVLQCGVRKACLPFSCRSMNELMATNPQRVVAAMQFKVPHHTAPPPLSFSLQFQHSVCQGCLSHQPKGAKHVTCAECGSKSTQPWPPNFSLRVGKKVFTHPHLSLSCSSASF